MQGKNDRIVLERVQKMQAKRRGREYEADGSQKRPGQLYAFKRTGASGSGAVTMSYQLCCLCDYLTER